MQENKKLYYKKIGELTQNEFEQLFNIPTDISEPSFRKRIEPFAEYSVSSINIEDYNLKDMEFATAYLLGAITAAKEKMPQNHLIVLFGEAGSGKSHIIKLISELKNREIKNVTQEDREFFGIDKEDHSSDMQIKELKDMVDSITIIQKKTTRISRDGKPNKLEIQEGLTKEEVQKCEWTYEFADNLYGITKKPIDEALKVGDAILIINDPSVEVTKELKETYSKNFIPVMVYVDEDMEKWEDNMKKSNRTDAEIQNRRKTFGVSQLIYEELWKTDMPDVIMNITKR